MKSILLGVSLFTCFLFTTFAPKYTVKKKSVAGANGSNYTAKQIFAIMDIIDTTNAKAVRKLKAKTNALLKKSKYRNE